MNRVELIGNWTKEPELRVSPSGQKIMSCSIALNRGKDRGADFINVVAFDEIASNCSKFTRKGSKVGISGRIQSRNYTSKDGSKKVAYEVVAEFIEYLSTKDSSEEIYEGELSTDDLPY